MEKLVFIKLVEGSFEKGFTVILQILEGGTIPLTQTPLMQSVGRLPPCPEIEKQYPQWQSAYHDQLAGSSRKLKAPVEQVTNGTLADIKKQAKNLSENLNAWLNSEEFQPLKEELIKNLKHSEDIRIIIETDNSQIRQLPWHIWDFFKDNTLAEIAFNSLSYKHIKKSDTILSNIPNKITILVIFGDDSNINIKQDRNFLESFHSHTEITILTAPSCQEIIEQLTQEKCWDILYFAGHSESLKNGKRGRIYLNQQDSLTIDDLKEALNKAIPRGLKLAIFNSCDGLGLAHDLEELNIPYTIVMREPVPDYVAQEFLKYLLTAFSGGKSLSASVRAAREELKKLEDKFPCASWLPVICQNSATESVTWQNLLDSKAQLPLSQRLLNGVSSLPKKLHETQAVIKQEMDSKKCLFLLLFVLPSILFGQRFYQYINNMSTMSQYGSTEDNYLLDRHSLSSSIYQTALKNKEYELNKEQGKMASLSSEKLFKIERNHSTIQHHFKISYNDSLQDSYIKYSYTCEENEGVPTTFIKIAQEKRAVIRWLNDLGKEAGYTPERRCQEVTARFNLWGKQQRQYVNYGIMNNQPVLCATDKPKGGCISLLYTLKPGDDPKKTLNDFLELNKNNFASSPVRE